MAITVTATTDPLTGTVLLRVAGGTPEYVVDATPAGDRPSYRVRTTWVPVTGAPTSRDGVDGAIPLGIATTYTATDATGAQGSSGVVTMTGTVALLSDATDPSRVLPVTVVSQPPNTWEGRSRTWDVLGRSDPFLSIAPMRYRNGDLILWMEDTVDRARHLALLAPGTPLLLRTPCGDAVDDVVLAVTTARDDLQNPDLPAGPRLLTLTYQAVSQQLGPYVGDPTRTYLSVIAQNTDYLDVLGTYFTYSDLLTGAADAGLGTELVTDPGFVASGSWTTTPWSTGVTWTFAGTGKAVGATAPGSAYVKPVGVTNLTVTPGATYRVTGRVRATNPAIPPRVEFLTNTAPQAAEYFAAGVTGQYLILTSDAVWRTFVQDFTVPAGDDRMTVYLRWAAGMAVGDIVEWDDLSVRVHL